MVAALEGNSKDIVEYGLSNATAKKKIERLQHNNTRFFPPNRLKTYIQKEGMSEQDRVFNLCYTSARTMINKLGEKVGIKLNPHDLRRHSATFASRNGVPLEIISKVLLRHQNLKTTQIYLGKVSDSEAMRWMDILHGK